MKKVNPFQSHPVFKDLEHKLASEFHCYLTVDSGFVEPGFMQRAEGIPSFETYFANQHPQVYMLMGFRVGVLEIEQMNLRD